VLVAVRFSDGSGAKIRPAVVLSTDAYHAQRSDAILVSLTTNVASRRIGDHRLRDWKASGLPRPSLAKASLETIQRSAFRRTIGTVSDRDLAAIEQGVRAVLGL
jgi:mRNA interferase MazF